MLDGVEIRARSAIEADPLLVPAHLALAQRYEMENQYRDALEVLNEALAHPQLKSNVNLIVERGKVYFQQGDLDQAAQEAYTALYIDPTVEEAYLLQIQTALEKGDPGLAVIYAQNYLFFYPGSSEGYRLLGDARVEEGNTDLALLAYNQALAAESTTPATVPALLARGNIYNQQRRYDLAYQDYARAFSLTNDPNVQAKRMEAAYLSGNYAVALADAEDLLDTGIVPNSQIDLLRARVLIDRADEDDTEALTQALSLLSNANSATASEYRARAQFMLGDFQNALNSIQSALNSTETGSRHFLRGQILEALEQPEQAAREYEWVLTWSEIYPFRFLPDARRRLNALRTASD
jgi:tetratricopeptide (TPR) repeat protein